MRQPLFTVLLTSHRKPGFVHHAIQTVLEQTCQDFELLILDSGELLPELLRYSCPPKVRVLRNGETPALVREVAIYAWIVNRFAKLANGQFIVYLCDDDYWLPDFLESFAHAIEPGFDCYWTGLEMNQVDANGRFIRKIREMLPIMRPVIGECGQHMVCIRTKTALEHPWPEEKETERHCDGLWMERLHATHPFKPVPGIHTILQRTPVSAYWGDGGNA